MQLLCPFMVTWLLFFGRRDGLHDLIIDITNLQDFTLSNDTIN